MMHCLLTNQPVACIDRAQRQTAAMQYLILKLCMLLSLLCRLPEGHRCPHCALWRVAWRFP
jgi:hypothetical protein